MARRRATTSGRSEAGAKSTTRIEATALQLWRLTLTMQLVQPDPQAGLGEVLTLWVNPDGTPGLTSGTQLQP
jgi:hypothetical protein